MPQWTVFIAICSVAKLIGSHQRRRLVDQHTLKAVCSSTLTAMSSNTMGANAPMAKAPPGALAAEIVAFVVIAVLMVVLIVGLTMWKSWNRLWFRGGDSSSDVEKQSIQEPEVDIKTPLIVTVSPASPEKVECAKTTTQSLRRAILLDSPTKLLETRSANKRWSLPPLYFQQSHPIHSIADDSCHDSRTHSMVENCDLRTSPQPQASSNTAKPTKSSEDRPRWPTRLATMKRKPVPPRMRPATGPRIAKFREEGLEV